MSDRLPQPEQPSAEDRLGSTQTLAWALSSLLASTLSVTVALGLVGGADTGLRRRQAAAAAAQGVGPGELPPGRLLLGVDHVPGLGVLVPPTAWLVRDPQPPVPVRPEDR